MQGGDLIREAMLLNWGGEFSMYPMYRIVGSKPRVAYQLC